MVCAAFPLWSPPLPPPYSAAHDTVKEERGRGVVVVCKGGITAMDLASMADRGASRGWGVHSALTSCGAWKGRRIPPEHKQTNLKQSYLQPTHNALSPERISVLFTPAVVSAVMGQPCLGLWKLPCSCFPLSFPFHPSFQIPGAGGSHFTPSPHTYMLMRPISVWILTCSEGSPPKSIHCLASDCVSWHLCSCVLETPLATEGEDGAERGHTGNRDPLLCTCQMQKDFLLYI